MAVEGKSVVTEWSRLSLAARRLARQGRARSIPFPIQHWPNPDTSLPTRGFHNAARGTAGQRPPRANKQADNAQDAQKTSTVHAPFVSLSSSARVTAEAERIVPN